MLYGIFSPDCCPVSALVPFPRLVCSAHPEAAEQGCLTQLLGGEMETLPGALQVFLASVVAEHTPTAMLNSRSPPFFPSFHLGDT